MAQPLDYRNLKRPDGSAPAIKVAKAVIPLEFDVVVARTQDNGAASAIEFQLKREGVQVFRTHDGPAVDQTIQLLVRAEDRARAALIATATLRRRQKLSSLKPR
jgi:hypothetical protein